MIDYTLSYNGNWIIYAEAREDGGSNLRLLDLTSGKQRLVFTCPERVLCQALELEPEGDICRNGSLNAGYRGNCLGGITRNQVVVYC